MEQNLLAMAMYPLENCISVHLLSCARWTLGQGYEYTSILDTMFKLWKMEGFWGGLYSGFGMRFIQLNLQLLVGFWGLDCIGVRAIDGKSNGTEKFTWIEAGVALTAAAVAYPFLFVLNKIRIGWVVPNVPHYSSPYQLVCLFFAVHFPSHIFIHAGPKYYREGWIPGCL